MKLLIKQMTIPAKAQNASYEVAYLIAQDTATISMSRVMDTSHWPGISAALWFDYCPLHHRHSCQLIDKVTKGRYSSQSEESNVSNLEMPFSPQLQGTFTTEDIFTKPEFTLKKRGSGMEHVHCCVCRHSRSIARKEGTKCSTFTSGTISHH